MPRNYLVFNIHQVLPKYGCQKWLNNWKIILIPLNSEMDKGMDEIQMLLVGAAGAG